MTDLKRIVLSKDVQNNASFLNCEKFERTGCDLFQCICENKTIDGVVYFDNVIQIMDPDGYMKSTLDPQDLKASTMGAGISLGDMNWFLQSKMLNVPTFLIPEEKCFINFIKFDNSGDAPKFKAICYKREECQNNRQFCEKLAQKDSGIYLRVKDIAITISSLTKKPDGYIPFVKYSTFIEYIIWAENFKRHVDTYLLNFNENVSKYV